MNKLLYLAINQNFGSKYVIDLYDKYLPIFEKVCKNNFDFIEWVNLYDILNPDEAETFLLDTLITTASLLGYFPHCNNTFLVKGDVVIYKGCEDGEDAKLVEEDLQKFEELTGIDIDIDEYVF
jgi:hypothetical protein